MRKLRIYILMALILLGTSQLQASDAKAYTWYNVVSIVDGDTIKISYRGRIESVRLYGIDAPERGQAGFFKAAAALEELCFGKKVRLVFPQKRTRDRYNRLLAELYLKDNTRVNEVLYRLGVVKLYKRSPLSVHK